MVLKRAHQLRNGSNCFKTGATVFQLVRIITDSFKAGPGRFTTFYTTDGGSLCSLFCTIDVYGCTISIIRPVWAEWETFTSDYGRCAGMLAKAENLAYILRPRCLWSAAVFHCAGQCILNQPDCPLPFCVRVHRLLCISWSVCMCTPMYNTDWLRHQAGTIQLLTCAARWYW